MRASVRRCARACGLLFAPRAGSESARKAVRRHAQVTRLRAQQAAESAAAATSTTTSNSAQTTLPDDGSKAASASAYTQGSLSHGRVSRGPVSAAASSTSGLIDANRTRRAVLLGAEAETALQLESRLAVRHAPSKGAALSAFLQLAHGGTDGGGGATVAALREVAAALVHHHAKSSMGHEAYTAALNAAIGSSEERWVTVSPAEAHTFARYQCQLLARHAERGSAFSEAAGAILEGADNAAVALLEFQAQRLARDVAPVPADVLADLMHLDVSWSAALRLYRTAQANRGVPPPVEMSERLMGLMVGYRSNGLGSRPWQRALRLYAEVLNSGYDTTLTTHACALDALWRSADDFHRVGPQRSGTVADRQRVWHGLLQVRRNVEAAGLRIAGDEGCAYYEALIKAVVAAGRTETALELLQDMDGTRDSTSFRLLVPTAETYAFVMAACNADGKAAHAEAIRVLFDAQYRLRDLHSEVLLVYLQSLRSVVRTNATIGSQLEGLLLSHPPTRPNESAATRDSDHHNEDSGVLDRPCTVACLQLLANRAVRLPTAEKEGVARRLFNMYDGSVWLQEPLPRKVELQTVLRCCYLISLHASEASGARVEDSPLLAHIGARLRDVFGADSAECEWLHDTEVYGLGSTADWSRALSIYRRQVTERPLEQRPFLPVPARQARDMTIGALLRCCRVAAARAGAVSGRPPRDKEICIAGAAAEGSTVAGTMHRMDHDDSNGADEFLFLEDAAQEEERERARQLAAHCATIAMSEVCADIPVPAAPCAAVAELLLIQALSGSEPAARTSLSVRAVRLLGLGDADAITTRLVGLVAHAMGITEDYAEDMLIDSHAALRGTALEDLCKVSRWCQSPLERPYL